MNTEPIVPCSSAEDWLDTYYDQLVQLFEIFKRHIDLKGTRFLSELYKVPPDDDNIFFQRFIEFVYLHSSQQKFTY